MAGTTHLVQLEFACEKLQLRTTPKKLLQTSNISGSKTDVMGFLISQNL